MARFLNLNLLVFVLLFLSGAAAQEGKTGGSTEKNQEDAPVEITKLIETSAPTSSETTAPKPEHTSQPSTTENAKDALKEESEDIVLPQEEYDTPDNALGKTAFDGSLEEAVFTTDADTGAEEQKEIDGDTIVQEGMEPPSNALGQTAFGGSLEEAVFTTDVPEKDMMKDVATSLDNPLGGPLDEELEAAAASEVDDEMDTEADVPEKEVEEKEAEEIEADGTDDDTIVKVTEVEAVTDVTEDAAAPAVPEEDILGDAMKAITDSADDASVTLYIASFECDLEHVIVSESDNTVTCSVAAEASHGVSTITAAFYNVPMTKRILMHFGEEDLISGSVRSGVWQLEVTIPKAADQGVWSLGFDDQGAFYGLEVTDKKGNTVNYAKQAAMDSIIPLQTSLTVESYAGNTVAYPQANVQTSSGVLIYGAACVDATATVTEEAKTIICEALIIPDEAGIGSSTIYMVGPTKKTVLPIVFDEDSEALLVPATNVTRTMFLLTSTLTVPTWAEPGAYSVPVSGAYQPRTLSGAATVRLINPLTLSAKPALTVVSVSDRSAPILSNFYCNNGRQVQLSDYDPLPVNCLLRATDDLSGVSYASLHFVSPSKTDAVEFAFVPSSPGLGPFPPASVKQVAENVASNFPPTTEPGAWTLARAVTTDNAGNYKEYTATELDNANVQTFFLVQSSTKTFSIAPKPGTAINPDPAPGQATSGAIRSSRPLLMAAALTGGAAVVCAMS
ncbi:hypothetical protein NSK_004380 [Nannochloropsis salina CCMP1776]|jgi:hypothetical protein|uniref:Uncharacterized protein n=1 Tax=Nannochloropsis salina CCMP1776 TaxID=1027361 RepID=A0A4D9D4P6_9STRA|nr:hypothetical protein NSK_004380 [Nannochloropsis salina CCMP1776]|eukprot:TFJ84395.1 hypothetical protein NSK_004380 [Nannochloropsis salina CCMP1776]